MHQRYLDFTCCLFAFPGSAKYDRYIPKQTTKNFSESLANPVKVNVLCHTPADQSEMGLCLERMSPEFAECACTNSDIAGSWLSALGKLISRTLLDQAAQTMLHLLHKVHLPPDTACLPARRQCHQVIIEQKVNISLGVAC